MMQNQEVELNQLASDYIESVKSKSFGGLQIILHDLQADNAILSQGVKIVTDMHTRAQDDALALTDKRRKLLEELAQKEKIKMVILKEKRKIQREIGRNK